MLCLSFFDTMVISSIFDNQWHIKYSRNTKIQLFIVTDLNTYKFLCLCKMLRAPWLCPNRPRGFHLYKLESVYQNDDLNHLYMYLHSITGFKGLFCYFHLLVCLGLGPIDTPKNLPSHKSKVTYHNQWYR